MSTAVDAIPITVQEAGAAFRDHLFARALAARRRYGAAIDAGAIVRMLEDRAVVRYPTALEFSAAPLAGREAAAVRPIGFHPAEGFRLFLHPHFRHRRSAWPLLVACRLPAVNYGDLVETADAEHFGAALLGLSTGACHRALHALAEEIPARGDGERPAAPVAVG